MAEVNKEQAEKCAEMGLKAAAEGDTDKAIRLLSKALRLHDLGPAVKGRLDALIRQSEGPASGSSEPADSPRTPSSTPAESGGGSASAGQFSAKSNAGASGSSSEGVRNRTAGAGAAARPAPPRPDPRAQQSAPQRPFTPEQAEIARKVKAAKDFYQLLQLGGLPTDRAQVNEDTVNRAYKKLAIKLHPDKNSAPGAEEAFKRLSTAYQTLQDAGKRQEYDLHGEDGPQASSGHPAAAHFRRAGGMPDDLSPEDIFNMMFGGSMGGMGTTRVYQDAFGNIRVQRGFGTRQPRSARGHGDEDDDRSGGAGQGWGQMLQLLPIFIFLLLSFLNFGGSDERLYSLKPEAAFGTQRETGSGMGMGQGLYSNRAASVTKGLPYWVKADFLAKVTRDPVLLQRVEQNVASNYLRSWYSGCHGERERWDQLHKQARWGRGIAKTRAEQELKLFTEPACENLRKFFRDDVPVEWLTQHKGPGVGSSSSSSSSGSSNSGKEEPFEKVELG